MHAAANDTPLTCAQWIELAQQHHGLLEAFHGVFGKRLPVVTKLGLWLSERCGQSAGDLFLHGRHSARRKGWIYRVVSKAKLAQLAEERRAALAQAPAPAVKVAPAPVLPVNDPVLNPYMSTSTVHGDGRVTREPVLGRDGQPLKLIPVAPEPAPEISSGQSDGRPPWLQRGERKPRDRAEWQEWQRGRSGAPSVCGFANPGGIVSHNIIVEDGNVLNYCHVAGVWPGGQR